MSDETPKTEWPDDVTPISMDNFQRMGIGRDQQLYWDGRRVETQRRLKLSWFQNLLAGAALLVAILNGFSDLASKLPDTPRDFATCQIEAAKIYPDSGTRLHYMLDYEDVLKACMKAHGYEMWNSCPSVSHCYEPRWNTTAAALAAVVGALIFLFLCYTYLLPPLDSSATKIGRRVDAVLHRHFFGYELDAILKWSIVLVISLFASLQMLHSFQVTFR